MLSQKIPLAALWNFSMVKLIVRCFAIHIHGMIAICLESWQQIEQQRQTVSFIGFPRNSSLIILSCHSQMINFIHKLFRISYLAWLTQRRFFDIWSRSKIGVITWGIHDKTRRFLSSIFALSIGYIINANPKLGGPL